MINIYNNLRKIIRKIIPLKYRAYLLSFVRGLKSALFFSHYVRSKEEFLLAQKFNDYFFILPKNKKDYILNKLKINLDTNSAKEIEGGLSKLEYILYNNLLDKKIIFNNVDLLEQKEWKRESKKIHKKIKNIEIKDFRAESFYGLSGLKWIPQEVKDRLKNGIFLDIGACDGDSSFAFYFNFSPEKIYSFEPETNNFTRLKNNIRILEINEITPVKLAASNLNMESNISKEDGRSKISNNKNDEKIELITIDNFIIKNELERVALIKMDIEGMEMSALKGAVETIVRFKPVLAISIYHKPEDFFEIKPWIEEICPDYKFLIKKANPCSSFDETMLLAYVDN